MEKADETTNVNGETSFIDPGKELSLQGGVEMNNATSLEGNSVILEQQNIEQDRVTLIQDLLTMVDFNNDEDQASNSKEVKLNDDGDGGYGDNSEVENDSSDSSIKLSSKHIKTKSNKKFRIAAVEDDDDSSESCKSDNSRFSQISSIEPQCDPKLLQFSGSSLLNSKESSSASAIDPSIKTHNRKKKTKEGDQIKDKDMAMLVFNPCIMVFSPLFNVIMLTLTILTRKH
jgi:hypothetical protein